jgi:hypothetical protein
MEPQLTSSEKEAIDKFAEDLSDETSNPKELSAAAKAIENGNGALVLDAMLDVQRTNLADEQEVILGTMSQLEKIFDAKPEVAGYLMARLYPLASRRFLHQTCDAIALWIDHSRSPALADNLVRLSNEGVRPQLQKLYQSWAEQIRDRR